MVISAWKKDLLRRPWSSLKQLDSLSPRCHSCHFCPGLKLTPCSPLVDSSVTMSPSSVYFFCPCCKTLYCGSWVSSCSFGKETGDCADCEKWASLLVLRNGPISLGSSNVCRKADLPLLWLPTYSKDRYILSPQELSAQSLTEMANSW